MPDAPDLENFQYLKDKVTELLDFECEKYSDSFLKRRFEIRLRKKDISTYLEYARLVEKSPEERTELKKELTVHVTHFFRDNDFWHAFSNEVIPVIADAKKKSGQKNIKVWSAGCSSGEEPVSIAISLLEKLGARIKDYNISILATDYDYEILNKAQTALYEEAQFRETDQGIKNRYFRRENNGMYTPIPEVRALITYRREDMLSSVNKNVDIILCRNVVIYFDRQAKQALYQKFYECLNPGGFLIIGKTEYIDGEAKDRFKQTNMRERIYQK